MDYVLAHYGLRHPSSINLISAKANRSVWRVIAEGAAYALKRLQLPPERTLFLTAAHEHLNTGGLVPRLIHTAAGDRFVDAGDECFVLMDWVGGRRLSYQNLDDVALMAESLAEVHSLSRGFRAPPESAPLDYVGTWPAAYRERCDLIRQSAAQLDDLGGLCSQAERAIEHLAASAYADWCQTFRQSGGFGHQDIAAGNVTLTPRGICIFDLDAIAVDLPARDLRKLINRVFVRRQECSKETLGHLAHAYSQVNQLGINELAVLLIDLEFPHLTARLLARLAEPGQDPARVDLLRQRLGMTAELEQTRGRVVNEYLREVRTL